MEVRTARPEDERRLAAIDHATWSWAVAPVPRWAEEADFFAEDSPDDVLVAEALDPSDDDGAPVLHGYVKLRRPTGLASNRHVLRVGGFAVDPALQGRGTGRLLLRAAAAEARRRGADRLTLHVLATNAPALRVYAACGFVVEGVLRGEFELEGRRVDDVLLALDLRGPSAAS